MVQRKIALFVNMVFTFSHNKFNEFQRFLLVERLLELRASRSSRSNPFSNAAF